MFFTAIYSAGLVTWLPCHQLMNEGSGPSDIYTKIQTKRSLIRLLPQKIAQQIINIVGKWGKITCLSFGGTMCAPQKVHISKTNAFNQRKLMTKPGILGEFPFLSLSCANLGWILNPFDQLFFTFYMFWSNKTIVRNHICSRQLSRWSTLSSLVGSWRVRGSRCCWARWPCAKLHGTVILRQV